MNELERTSMVAALSGRVPALQAHAGETSLDLVIAKTAHGFTVGQVVRYDGATSAWVLAQGDTPTHGLWQGMISQVLGVDAFRLVIGIGSRITGLTGLTAGSAHFLSRTTPGGLTTTPNRYPVLFATSTTEGLLLPPPVITPTENAIINIYGHATDTGVGAYAIFQGVLLDPLTYSSLGISVWVTGPQTPCTGAVSMPQAWHCRLVNDAYTHPGGFGMLPRYELLAPAAPIGFVTSGDEYLIMGSAGQGYDSLTYLNTGAKSYWYPVARCSWDAWAAGDVLRLPPYNWVSDGIDPRNLLLAWAKGPRLAHWAPHDDRYFDRGEPSELEVITRLVRDQDATGTRDLACVYVRTLVRFGSINNFGYWRADSAIHGESWVSATFSGANVNDVYNTTGAAAALTSGARTDTSIPKTGSLATRGAWTTVAGFGVSINGLSVAASVQIKIVDQSAVWPGAWQWDAQLTGVTAGWSGTVVSKRCTGGANLLTAHFGDWVERYAVGS